MSGKITILNSENFDTFIKEGNSVIDFYADWCGPCKTMAPEFNKASEEIKGVNFGKVNIDGNQDIAMRFQVMSIPTIIFFKREEQIDRHTGPLNMEQIKERVEKSFG
jgi:thioredoxin 1